jgi:APA family basic amino acid/polyamine antiporter
MASVPAPASLERRLGPFDAAAVIVSNVIGGGILFTPPQVAAMVPDPWWFLGTWLAGGLLAFAGAMAYAELAAVRPRAGGEYVYLRAAFGNVLAFLSGWTSFVAGFAGAIAASASVLAFYLSRFIPWVGSDAVALRLPLPLVTLSITPQTLTALVAIWLMALVHRRGVGPGRIVSNVLASLKVGALLLFIVLGMAWGSGDLANLQPAAHAPISPATWLFALIPVMFTYSGWNAAGYIAEEVRDPGRNVPRALALGTLTVIAIYACLNALYLYVFPVQTLAALQGSVLDKIAESLLGAAAGDIMGVVSIVGLLASISAMTFAGPRVYFAMARDGLFFSAAARVHPVHKTPSVAILSQSAWATLLVLTGSADSLTTYTGFAVVLFAGLGVTALFVLRRREPDAPRPYRALGYPLAPAVFTGASTLIVGNALWTDLGRPLLEGRPLGPSAAGLFVIGLGLPLYWWLTQRRAGTSS